MPGAYDALSARLFEDVGFSAIQGSSGAIAASLGYPDGEVLTRDQTVEVTRRMVNAVSVPVNADGEKGYGDTTQMAETVRAFIYAGAAGMNVEDSAPRVPGQRPALVPLAQHFEKLSAILAARQAIGSEFFLNARVDALMVLRDDPDAALREALTRGRAYAEAGADCIFFMNAHTREVISRLVQEIPAPVSVLAGPLTIPLAELEALGVARVSYGYAFALAAAGAMRRLAREILESGTVTALQDALSVQDLTRLMARQP